MIIENQANVHRMKKCPSFIKCSAPKCPLDMFIKERALLPNEPKCTISKKKRVVLGDGLKYHGLTSREYRGIVLTYGTFTRYFKRILSGVYIVNKNKQPINGISTHKHLEVDGDGERNYSKISK